MIINIVPSLLNLFGLVFLMRSIDLVSSDALGISEVDPPTLDTILRVAVIRRESSLKMMIGLVLHIGGFFLQFYLVLIGLN